jgi:hypothetical protein
MMVMMHPVEIELEDDVKQRPCAYQDTHESRSFVTVSKTIRSQEV